jgi:uncharacterized protein
MNVLDLCNMIDDRNIATFKFYAELNDFLPPNKQNVEFKHAFSGKPAIKAIIEAIGVPHTEVDLILVNHQSVAFTYHLQQNDKAAVYAKYELSNITHRINLRAMPLRENKFVVDIHLGKLARYLRLLGFDTLFDAYYQDDEIVALGGKPRIILTRDKGILKNKNVAHGLCIVKKFIGKGLIISK